MKSFIRRLAEQLTQNKGLRQTIIKNSVWLSSANLLAKLFKLLLVPLAARILGPEEYGVFGYTVALITTIFFFTDLGVSAILIREYPKDHIKKDTLISTAFFLKAILIILATLCAFLTMFLLKDPLVRSIYGILTLMIVIDRIKDFFIAICQAVQKMEYEGIAFIIETGLTTLLGIITLLASGSLIYFALSYLAGSTAAFIAILMFTRPYTPRLRAFDRRLAGTLLRLSLPFTSVVLIAMILSTTDALMIKWLMGAAFVGYYQAAQKLIDIAMIKSQVLVKSLNPLSATFYNDHNRLITFSSKGLAWLLLIGLPVTVGGMVLADALILWLFGAEYSASILPFRILAVTALLTPLLLFLNQILLVLNYQNQNMMISALSALLNIVLNFAFIFKFGIAGVAAATVIAKLTDILLTYLFCVKRLKRHFLPLKSTAKYAVATAAMAAVCAVLAQFSLFFLLNIAVSALVYAGVLVLLREEQVMSVVPWKRKKV